MRSRRWGDLTPVQKVAVVLVGAVQLALALSAWIDLARRPAAQVNGPKVLWAGLIAINWIGPIAYFRRGRRSSGSAGG